MSEQAYHFYATTAFGWAIGSTLAEALARCARISGLPTKLGKGSPPMYCCTYKVGVPQTDCYKIENYMPKGVKLSDRREFELFNNLGHCLPIESVSDGS